MTPDERAAEAERDYERARQELIEYRRQEAEAQEVDAEGGIGEIQVRGLRREGQHWINDAYDNSKVQIHLDIQGGVGQINLFAE